MVSVSPRRGGGLMGRACRGPGGRRVDRPTDQPDELGSLGRTRMKQEVGDESHDLLLTSCVPCRAKPRLTQACLEGGKPFGHPVVVHIEATDVGDTTNEGLSLIHI